MLPPIAWLGVWALVLIAGALACRRWFVLRRILVGLERGLEALEAGRPIRPIRARSGGRWGRLARRFDAVAAGLEGRLEALGRDVEQLRVVLGGMSEGVIAIDARRRLLFANASADRLFGLDARSIGRLVPELIRSPELEAAVDATLAGDPDFRGELAVPGREVLPRAAPRILSVQGTRLPGNWNPGAVLVFHDISELRRLERMRQDFVANASHELKTPLASIKAYTETLLDWAIHDEEVNVRFLRRIDEQADRLHQLVQDLLSLARLESGGEVFHHGPLEIRRVVEALAEVHRGRAESKGLDFVLDLGDLDDETRVVADEEAVRQILDNLLDNAIKYTPEGGRIRLRCRADGSVFTLDVVDSGIGIPRDDLPRVFERFYRVDKARSRELGGTGLGLSIVKHLVQSIGGQVEVASRLGEGSRFTVHLPRQRAAGPA
ncbi:sensor histidine kinase [Tundrisphaera sp. TA3]|uniref:sensor histidine kinase n=1 Tax=Tundrisphaera sp. TA3 TaxID=3435775 RepID=UPI003EBF973A